MQIKLNIKPVHVSGFDFIDCPRSKQEVINLISRGQSTVSCGSQGTYLSMGRDSRMARVYNLEKRRKVVEVLAKPKKWTKKMLRANGFLDTDVKYTTRIVKTPAHWVGVYYDIPLDVLKLAGLKVVQGNRTFYITKAR